MCETIKHMLRASDTRNRTSEFFSPLLELIHLKEKKKKCFLISAMRTNSVFLSSGGGDYLLVKVPNALTSGPYISAGYFSFAVSQQTLLKTFNCIETFSIHLKKWLKMHSLFLKFTKSLGPVFVGLCSS